MDYGYSTSVYSTPSSNYNTAYQREKQGYTNGAGVNTNVQGGVGGGTSSNTVICANVCTCMHYAPIILAAWQIYRFGIFDIVL